ncbi:MAG: hypothetical protein ACRESJ_12920 [Pseudomonas sp.]|uniref:hypothetical protein n=1 Tax=Pseudomonas sp. TaxID=306 RepID=UPI003D6E81F5
MDRLNLIRIFHRFLHLLPAQIAAHNVSLNFHNVGGFMGKMAIFLGGFLVVTILIGMLATISPV